MHGTLLAPQPHGFDRQGVQTPGGSTVKQRVKAERATLQGAFDPMPAPAQVRNKGQGRTGEAALAMDELAGAQREEHDADEVRGARGQAADEGVNSIGCQIHWRDSQGKW